MGRTTEPQDDAKGNVRPTAARRKRLSMHEGIAVWADCCSCAAEPYWLEVAEEMGIDLGSDYEDDENTASAG